MLLRIARMRIILAIVSVCFVVYGVITTIHYSTPHRSSRETTERALMTYTLIGLYSFSAAILCMKLLYPSIVIGTVHDRIMAKASNNNNKHQHRQRFNSTAEDNYTRLPTVYSNSSSDDVDTIVIIGGEVIDLVEEEKNTTDEDPVVEERKSMESNTALPHTDTHTPTRTTMNRPRNQNTVNFELDRPLGDRTEVSNRRDQNIQVPPLTPLQLLTHRRRRTGI